MIESFRQTLGKLSLTVPLVRRHRPARRVRLGFYGFQYRKVRRRSVIIARGAVAAALLVAAIAVAGAQLAE